MHLEVERLVTGGFTLPTLYIAWPRGQIGPDCFIHRSNLDPFDAFTLGQRSLYFLHLYSPESVLQMPVPNDPRHRFLGVSRSYVVNPDGTILFPVIDDTPSPIRESFDTQQLRRIPLEQAIREIVTTVTTSTPTPTR